MARNTIKTTLDSSRLFITGSSASGDTILTSSYNTMTSSFTSNDYLNSQYLNWTEGGLVYILQKMQQDINDLFVEVSKSVYEEQVTNLSTITTAQITNLSGSLIPIDSSSDSLGSITKPFKDVYVTTGSMIFVKNDGSTTRLSEDDWTNVKSGRLDNIGSNDLVIDGNILPKDDRMQELGSSAKRWRRLYVSSHIDVSGSELIISSPSASSAGNDFNIILSGSILPSNTGSDSLGSLTKPFKDVYVTTGSMIFVKNDGSTSRFTEDDWSNVKSGRLDNIGSNDLIIDGNILPKDDRMQELGSAAKRWRRVYVSSHIDVSGSELIISSPSASAAGNDFNIVLSGSILPSNTGSDSLGSLTKPFKDVYVTTGSMIFVKNDGTTSRLTEDDWSNVKSGRYDSIGSQDLIVDGDILPKTDAAQAIGSTRKRFSRIYLASHIDVSGSELLISSPSASAAGNDFNIVLSGSLLPSDSDNDSIGSEEAPFKDLYVTTGSLIYVDRSVAVGHTDRKVSFSRNDVERLRDGKLLKDKDDNRVKAKIQLGQEITGSTVYKIEELPRDDTTPDISDGTIFKTTNTSCYYSNFDAGTAGQRITILIQDGNSDFRHDTRKIYLSGGRDWTDSTIGDSIEFVYNGAEWIETNRSDNT